MNKISIDTERIGAYIRLVRGGNLLFLAMLLYVMEKWVAVPLLHHQLFPEQLPWWVLLLLIVATTFIAAGGYVINDYFDIKIDKINRPDRQVIPDIVSKDVAMKMFYVLTIAGVAAGITVSIWAHSWILALVFLIIPGLLWFYSASYKRQFLVGNIVVAFTTAVAPLLVAITNVDYLTHLYRETLVYSTIVKDMYIWVGCFALFAFILTFAREIVKDMEDKEGDCEYECRTLPIRYGDVVSKVIVTILMVVVMVMVCYLGFVVVPFSHAWSGISTRYIVFGLLVPCICDLVLLWFAHSPHEYHSVQALMKFVMLMGVLYSFVIVRCL